MKTEARTDRWMAVDDNPEILAMMRDLLSELRGGKVESFGSPLNALAALKAAPEEYELVITDFEMPGMDGRELCRQMLKLNPALKIFLATGSGFFVEAETQADGFCGLLHKPFSLDELYRAFAKSGVVIEIASLMP